MLSINNIEVVYDSVILVLRGVSLDVKPGDIYVFNGGHVHGVEASADASKRTTLAWNMGFCDDTTVVTWT